MLINGALSFETAMMAGRSAEDLDVAADSDPVARRGLFVSGGGPGGGGTQANFMPALFPAGALPVPEAMAAVVANHHLAEGLRSGHVYYAMRSVQGFQMPELQALFSIRSPVDVVVRAMNDVNTWAQWMPRFEESVGRPDGSGCGQYQRAVMSAVGLKIKYQVRVTSQPVTGGHQIHWRIDETGFKKGFLDVGLAVNNGTFTATALSADPSETLVAYSIHTQPKPLVPGTAATIQATTLREFPEFPASLSHRAQNPFWRRGFPVPGASDRTFRMVSLG